VKAVAEAGDKPRAFGLPFVDHLFDRLGRVAAFRSDPH